MIKMKYKYGLNLITTWSWEELAFRSPYISADRVKKIHTTATVEKGHKCVEWSGLHMSGYQMTERTEEFIGSLVERN